MHMERMDIMESISDEERRIWLPISMYKQNLCTISVSSGTHCTRYFQRAVALTSTWTTIGRQTIPVSLVNLIWAPAPALSTVAGQVIVAHTRELITLTGTSGQRGLCNFRHPTFALCSTLSAWR